MTGESNPPPSGDHYCLAICALQLTSNKFIACLNLPCDWLATKPMSDYGVLYVPDGRLATDLLVLCNWKVPNPLFVKTRAGQLWSSSWTMILIIWIRCDGTGRQIKHPWYPRSRTHFQNPGLDAYCDWWPVHSLPDHWPPYCLRVLSVPYDWLTIDPLSVWQPFYCLYTALCVHHECLKNISCLISQGEHGHPVEANHFCRLFFWSLPTARDHQWG